MSQNSGFLITKVEPRESGANLRALIETTKPGITRLVTITALVGFALSALAHEAMPVWTLAISAGGTLLGTALSASGVTRRCWKGGTPLSPAFTALFVASYTGLKVRLFMARSLSMGSVHNT